MIKPIAIFLIPLAIQVLGLCMVFDLIGWPWWLPAAIVACLFVIPKVTITPTINTALWIVSLGGWIGGMARAVHLA